MTIIHKVLRLFLELPGINAYLRSSKRLSARTKCGFRIFLSAAVLAGLYCFIMWGTHSFVDMTDKNRLGSYIRTSLEHYLLEVSERQFPTGSAGHDKIIVVAKLEEEDASWVANELPNWQRAIYTVDPTPNTNHSLTTSVNKGHETMAYLTYIIDHYDGLPSTIVFLHSHRHGFFKAWHVDTPLHDNVAAIQMLQLSFVQRNGYANLRCNWNPGCEKSQRWNIHLTQDIWEEVFEATSTPPANQTFDKHAAYEASEKKGLRVAATCCAQFAVSRQQVLKRPKSDYENFRFWVTNTGLPDSKSGRIFEFLWHIIFGMERIYCPDEEKCYCDVYGRC